MIPGVGQAIVISNSSSEGDLAASWPGAGAVHEDLVAAANMAASQNKSVTTTRSTGPVSDSAVDMIIALPLTKTDAFSGTLAVLVNIKPSQQSIVTQVLHWGEDWLALLLRQQQAGEQASASDGAERRLSGLPGGRATLVTLAILLIAALLSVVPGVYQVTAPASLEGRIQRVIVAPFDGFIANAHARAGDTVAAGEVIAELDTQELVLERQRYAAEKNEYTRQYRKALAARQQTQAHIFKSQVNQAQAQLGLLEKKIQRASLASTIDGVILSGDLSRALGKPVATGEVLFEVAPLDEYRLVIFVDEKQVADVSQDLQGSLTLKALPASSLPFTVHRVSPVFEENANGISYRVEASLLESPPALRPGMQGIAKIEIDRRSYLWIYLHELVDLLRLWAWRWLP